MSTTALQPRILEPVASLGRSITFRVRPDASTLRATLERLADDLAGGGDLVLGIGEPLARALDREVPGLRAFPALAGRGPSAPSTQQALWVFLQGPDRGALFDASERLRNALAADLELDDAMDLFKYAGGRDLTGYEDGTENPEGDAALDAVVCKHPSSLSGSSFVAVQRWVHDLARFRSFDAPARDALVGRSRETNEELDDAPKLAHVKRTAQESFEPAAFMLRRSMPWATSHAQGLEFVSFVASLDRFERMLARMLGLEDGIVDGLFMFSRPITGGYYWCPPVRSGRLDLSLLGI